MKADMILKNGCVQTMTAGEPAEALAICDGEIIYVGSNEGADALASDQTRIIDLKGRMVAPGFIDGHTHDVTTIISIGRAIYLNETRPDLDLYQAVAEKFIKEHEDLSVIHGYGLDLTAYGDDIPNNRWLDAVCQGKPVMIRDLSTHGALLSSAALALLGIDRDTPVPDGATIFRYENGEPTGYTCDAVSLTDPYPPLCYTKEDYREAFLKYQAEANSYGITGIDGAGPVIPGEEVWEVLHEMEEAGQLTLRVNMTVWDLKNINAEGASNLVTTLDRYQHLNSDYLRISQAKTFIDGVPEGKSAYLLEPYAPEAGEAADYCSAPAASQKDLDDFVQVLDKAGYQVQIHAMGDGGVNMALNSFEKAEAVNGRRDSRHIIAHVTLITEEDMDRMAGMHIIGAMQPLWWYYDPSFSCIEETFFGHERFLREYHIRDMMEKGIRITGSIDFPIQLDFQPLHGIETGVTQASPYAGQKDDPAYVRQPSQGVSPYQMLACYTVNGAYEMKMDNLIGTIEVGKKADLVVLGQNILTCDPKTIADTSVDYTISNGRIVYQRR